MKKGYSLVELMVAISIIGILVSFAISAYTKGRDRQEGRAAGEQIISILTSNQKKANIGDRDCTGLYLGQSVTINSDTTLSSVSNCSSSSGTTETTSALTGISSISPAPITILFKPLAQGITLAPDPLNITYVTSSGTTFMVQISSSGAVEYKGIQ